MSFIRLSIPGYYCTNCGTQMPEDGTLVCPGCDWVDPMTTSKSNVSAAGSPGTPPGAGYGPGQAGNPDGAGEALKEAVNRSRNLRLWLALREFAQTLRRWF